MCCIQLAGNTGRKNDAKNRHLRTIAQLCRAVSSHTIRPVLEYCCCVWHHNISNKLALQIENIQKRAIKIIFEHTRRMPYSSALYCANLSSLQHRRDQQARKFLKSSFAPDSCLHSLLPAPRDKNLVARLRTARTLPALAFRTKRCQSSINFGLLHYQ